MNKEKDSIYWQREKDLLMELWGCPHVSQLIDFCEEGDNIYLLLKWVEGLSLDRVMALKKDWHDFERFCAFMVKVLL